MNREYTNLELEIIASELRLEVMKMLQEAGSGHASGPLGLADVFCLLYFEVLRLDLTKKEDWQAQMDYLLVSNGHIAPIWYASLAKAGFFPQTELSSLRKLGSPLEGHPKRGSLPGIFNSSGPLGHGQGQAIGLALALKQELASLEADSAVRGREQKRVFLICSDGEQQEGANWESLLVANKYKLNNLTYILDWNNIQIDGFVEDIMPLPDLEKVYTDFGWKVQTIDGHNFDQLRVAIENASPENSDKPNLIIAKTVGGKGVSFIENDYNYHDWKADEKEAKQAIYEIEQHLKQLKSQNN